MNKSVKFNNMADYHFVPPEKYRQKRTVSDDLDNKENDEEVFMPPPCYTKWLTPYGYHFEENIFSAKGDDKIKQEHASGLDETVDEKNGEQNQNFRLQNHDFDIEFRFWVLKSFFKNPK